MLAYIIRRLLLIIPTLLGIMVINFGIVQLAPGGPVEQIIAQLTGTDVGATARISSAGGTEAGATSNASSRATSGNASATSKYRGAQGLDPEFIKQLETQFGFDKPMHERFLLMMGNYLRFDFGTSYFRDESVVNLVIEKMPVSISLGLWTTLIMYLVCIPLGIRKAVNDGTPFDLWTTTAMIVGFAVPSFVLAVLLVVMFSGGSFLDWFPLRGLTSENWDQLSWPMKVLDYLWHMVLPLTALLLGSFLGTTMLTKNSFLDQINMQYVQTARAKGLPEHRVMYGHVFRNAMLIVIAGFPGAFISILFSSSLLIEIIFSLDGLGLLGFEALIKRDYPIIFGTLFFFTLLGLVMKIIGDLTYTIVDPRIDFEARDV
ncbi:MAG: microcin C ABC transporter permease YejB [Rhodospirillaceae bacterium]|jgi:microcin C transport system permease protein|nr:microcin C ABC transporter permease YejB [Rhodospirillaceae bacterium]